MGYPYPEVSLKVQEEPLAHKGPDEMLRPNLQAEEPLLELKESFA
jgi:hypothetical protein